MHVPRTTAAALAVLLGGVTAGEASALTDDDKNARPPIVVEVGNPDPELAVGALTTYTITVRNRTAEPLPRTVVTQLLPEPLRHVSSRPGARVAGREVVWRLPLPAHGTRSITMTGRVGDIAEKDLAAGRTVQAAYPVHAKKGGTPRLATTVCVRAMDRGQLLTCSTASARVTQAFWRANRPFMTISAAAALVIGVVGVVLVRRWRTPRDV